MRTAPAEQRRSAAELVERIIGNLQGIIRNELTLLRVQLVAAAGDAGSASVSLAIGAGLALLAAGCLLLSGIYLLSTRLPPWVAALLVAGVCGAGAAALIFNGRQQLVRLASDRAKAFETIGGEGTWATTPDNSSR